MARLDEPVFDTQQETHTRSKACFPVGCLLLPSEVIGELATVANEQLLGPHRHHGVQVAQEVELESRSKSSCHSKLGSIAGETG